MAENISTLLNILQNQAAFTPEVNDLLYLVHGTGSDRDKVITLGWLLMNAAKVRVNANDATPGFLIDKLAGNAVGLTGDAYFDIQQTASGPKVIINIKSDSISTGMLQSGSVNNAVLDTDAVHRNNIQDAAVYGSKLNAIAVSKENTVSVSSGTTRVKVTDLDAVYPGGLFDIDVRAKYTGSGFSPNDVVIKVEDASGNVLRSWTIGSFSGEFYRRMVGKAVHAANTSVLSLYLECGSAGTGWTGSVDIDGMIIR